jgi:5-oxoprolinase (ATP-hydrolysing)
MAIRVGVDTGGTFTDFVALDESTGELTVSKRPSTPADPTEAVLEALVRSGVDPKEIALFVLGTTIGTNAVLQRSGSRVLFLTTEGFEDIPFIQRIDKKDPYDLQWEKPIPFVRRRDSLGVQERMTYDGTVLLPLTNAEAARVMRTVEERLEGEKGDVAIAVSLLFSFANRHHEDELKRLLAEKYPEIPVSISSETSPMWREYERASTTIIDAYLKPITRQFIGELEKLLKAQGVAGAFAVMKSNGGQMTSEAAMEHPIHTMFSGLSGGVIAGRYFGGRANRKDVVTFDMGGTSTDVAIVQNGLIGYTNEHDIDFNIPVSSPVIQLKTIGAGGGSIAWVDHGGLLQVGPQSAGASPGPVCYGKDGTDVTVTDANLVLGRLNASYFLGGDIRLDEDRARKSVADLGMTLGLSMEATALAVVEIANENMANAIRVLTIEKGLDPRGYSLVAFGGAGPLHGAEVAAALGMKEIIIPPHPGLTSAFGTLVADLRVDRKWTHYYRSDAIDLDEANQELDKLVADTVEELRSEGLTEPPTIFRSISMRYAGQNYERDIQVPSGDLTPASFQELLDEFHREHHKFYGYNFPDEIMEVISFNVTAVGVKTPPMLKLLPAGEPAKLFARRLVYFKTSGYIECPIYRREDLTSGQVIEGPAVVEEMDSTTLVHPGQSLSVAEDGIMSLLWKKLTPDGNRAKEATHATDSVTLAILNNNLVNIAQEMGTALMHTAYSPIFSESRDFDCGLFDRDGDMIAQGGFCPAQVGAISVTVKWAIAELGVDAFEPGDVLIHNDPYRGGCHMPEHMLLKPVFFGGELVGFAALIGHIAEIGAMAVGSFASTATEVYQEGLRLPPVKLMSRGEYVKDVWKIVLANHRTPRNTWGDFHAMIGGLNLAERRLLEMIEKYGADFVHRATEELIAYSERMIRDQIRHIPIGRYSSEDEMEDDGITNRPYKMKATVVLDGSGEVLVDFTGTDPQAAGPINATYGVTASATYNAILQIAGRNVPRNAGCYRPVKIIAPPGSLLNVRYPGPSVGGNTETHSRIIGIVLGAIGKALPEKVMADEGATCTNFLFGGVHPKTGRFYVHYHFDACGWGGRHSKDGNSAQNHIQGNCRNTPVEVFETLFPFVVESYALRPDSGGAGRQRGGLGTRRVLRVAAPQITVSALFDRVKVGPRGILGGMPGALAGMRIKRNGERAFRSFPEVFGVISPSKFANLIVHEGDRIMIDTAGGGGYGNPRERDPALLTRDLQEGYVTPAAARELYGLESPTRGTARASGSKGQGKRQGSRTSRPKAKAKST